MNLPNHLARLQMFFISTIAALVLMYSATARSQEIHTTMATIEGKDGYTMSGNTWCGHGEATSTIKPGERFIARELSYTIKDLEVYPPGERQALEWLGTGRYTSGRESPALFLVIRFVSCLMNR